MDGNTDTSVLDHKLAAYQQHLCGTYPSGMLLWYGALPYEAVHGTASGFADGVGNADKGFTQEQVDEMIQSTVAELKPFDSDNAGFTVTVKGEGGNVTAVSCNAEDIQSVVDVLQMNADDGAKAVASVQSDSVLILLHVLDTRTTVKKAVQKQHDTLFSAEGNSNESTGGNATTDSNTEGADT